MKANYDGLDNILKANNMSRTSMIRKIGVPTSVVSAMAHQKPMSMQAAITICSYFCCDLSEIMALVLESDDIIQFKISVFAEELIAADYPDVIPQYNTDQEVFEFMYILPNDDLKLIATFSYGGIPASRQQMKEDTAYLLKYLKEEADRQRELYYNKRNQS